jgi:hypothetical protein
VLHLMQPIARLAGRIGRGLTPWRRRGVAGFCFPWKRNHQIWSETWQAPEERLAALEGALRERGASVRRGGDFDRWDLELRAGLLGSVRIDLVCEEHGQGKQLVRVRIWPKATNFALMLIVALTTVAALDAAVAASTGALICGIPAWLLALRTAQECAAGIAVTRSVLLAQETQMRRREELLKDAVQGELGVPSPPLQPPISLAEVRKARENCTAREAGNGGNEVGKKTDERDRSVVTTVSRLIEEELSVAAQGQLAHDR